MTCAKKKAGRLKEKKKRSSFLKKKNRTPSQQKHDNSRANSSCGPGT
jgi:hypothetical protein